MSCLLKGIPFLVSISQGINLVTAERMPSRTTKQLAAGIRCIMDLYLRRGFQVGTVLMNNKFEKLRVLIPIHIVNTAASKDHVPEVVRHIHLIKERGRGILNTLTFKKMPQIMLIKLIYHVVLWLNAFPTKSGVSIMLLPCKIVYTHKLDFAKHCKAQFSTYCKAHDEPTPMNMMVTCCDSIPQPESIIKKVEQFGKSNARLNTLNLADRNGILVEWNDKVDKHPKGLVEEDVVLYLSWQKFPG
jgi:hypothetical protein